MPNDLPWHRAEGEREENGLAGRAWREWTCRGTFARCLQMAHGLSGPARGMIMKDVDRKKRRRAGRAEEMAGRTGPSRASEAERERAHETPWDERNFASAILDIADALIVVLDRDGRVVRFNRACEELTGYSEQEVRGTGIWDLLLPPGEVEPVKAVFEQLRAGHFPNRFENHWVTRGGQQRLIAWSNTALLNPAGAVQYVIATGIDVTERRRAEEERERLLDEVQRRAAELETIVGSVADGLVIYNAAGDVVRINSVARKLLGFSEEDLRLPIWQRLRKVGAETAEGKPFAEGTSPSERALRGETVQGLLMVLHPGPGKSIWVSSSAAPLRWTGGRLAGVVATFTDVTPLHRLQEQRTRYVLSISHGLRTPLTVVQGRAQLLLRAIAETAVDGRIRRGIEAILNASYRMSTVLRDLVDLTQLEAGQPLKLNLMPLDLHRFTTSLVARMSGLLQAGRIRIDAPEDLPKVLADPDRVERILVNLLTNALKYSGPSTEVMVSLRQQDGRVVTSVTDRGPGIPPAEIAKLFEPYERARERSVPRETVGLGLYISRGLVEAQGGEIWVESEVGRGSTFRFTLPVAP